MPYTRAWQDLVLGSNAANSIDNLMTYLREDISERLTDILDIVDFTADPLVAKSLKLNRHTTSKILGGTTSLAIRNAADTLDNVLIDNATGNVTVRGSLVATGGLPALNNLNASNLTSGTIPDARFPAVLPATSGANLTNLNAANLASGIIPDARFPAVFPTVSAVNLTNLNATQLTSGTIPDGRFPAILPVSSGINLTSLNASALSTGSVPSARLNTISYVFAPASITNNLTIFDAAATTRGITFSTAATQRFFLGINDDAEFGGQLGSNFVLLSYTDAGVFQDTVLGVARVSGGAITVNRPIDAVGGLNASQLTSGTLSDARLSAAVLLNTSSLNASNLLTGTIPAGRINTQNRLLKSADVAPTVSNVSSFWDGGVNLVGGSTDMAGHIQLWRTTTGTQTPATPSTQARINFNTAYSTAPIVLIHNKDGNLTNNFFRVGSVTTTYFELDVIGNLDFSGPFGGIADIYYLVVG